MWLTNKKYTFVILLAFSAFACNSTSDNSSTNDNPDNTPNQITSNTPSKIDFEIPEALKLKNLKRLSKKVRDNNQSNAFKLLKEKIAEAQDFSNDIKIQFVLIDNALPDIKEKCKEIQTDALCTIPTDQIHIDVDQDLIDKLIDIDKNKGDKFASELKNTTYSFGVIEYTSFADSNDYQFRIKTTDTESDSITLQWSKDYTLIDTEKSNETTDTYSHSYKIENNIETVKLENSNSTFDFELSLKKLNDAKNTFTLTSSYDYLSPTYIDGYTKTTSNGEVNDSKGSLESKLYVDNEHLFNHSIEYFDTQGQVDRSIYCDDLNSFECDYADQSTWIEYIYPIAYIDNIPLDIVNTAFESGVSLDYESIYYLLPLNTVLTDLTASNIEALSVGSFTADFPGDFGDGFKQLIKGKLHDLDFKDKLDQLDVYLLEPNEELISKFDKKDLIISLKP